VSTAQVTTTEAARLVAEADYVYLDVRSVQEFELGHVQGAFNVPWRLHGANEPNPQFLPVLSSAFARTQRLVVGCQSGQRSALACALLEAHGFEHVVEHRAGFGGLRDAFGKLLEAGWQRAGLPVSFDAQPGRSYRELCDGVLGAPGPSAG